MTLYVKANTYVDIFLNCENQVQSFILRFALGKSQNKAFYSRIRLERRPWSTFFKMFSRALDP